MPVGVEPVNGDWWHAAPGILQQMRRCYMEPCPGRRARRALFGPTDREETRRFVKEELATIRASDQTKYNFDFENMRPLTPPPVGGYEWEAVKPGDVPAGYEYGRLTTALLQHRSARRLDFNDQPASATQADHEPGLRISSISPTSSREAVASESGSARTSPAGALAQTHRQSSATSSSLRQTSITDYWRSCKRPSSGSAGRPAKRPISPQSQASDDPPAVTTPAQTERTE